MAGVHTGKTREIEGNSALVVAGDEQVAILGSDEQGQVVAAEVLVSPMTDIAHEADVAMWFFAAELINYVGFLE
jgi:hypothetical protein